MAYLDQYIVNHADRTLRLVGALDAGRSALPVVRVGSREFQKYVDGGYRMHNPHNAAIGVHRVMQLTVPGYALANEFVGGHGSHSRLAAKRGRGRSNPDDIGQLGYTTWAGVQAMKKRASEMSQPELVKVFAESTANHAHQQISIGLSKGKLPHRITLAPFSVTDKKRVYGYAPEKWIEEDYEVVRAAEDAAHDRQVDQMITKTKAIQVKVEAKVKSQSAEIQARMDPKVDDLIKAIDKRIAEIESKGVDAKPTSVAAVAVEKKVEAVEKELTRLQKLAKVAGGALKGAREGWSGKPTGFEVDRSPFVSRGKQSSTYGYGRRGRRR